MIPDEFNVRTAKNNDELDEKEEASEESLIDILGIS